MAMHHLISGINFLSHSASLAQNTLLMMSHSLIHLPPTHHSHLPSHIHCFISGSKLTFITKSFPPQSASTHLDCLGLYWTGLTLLNGLSFLVNFFFFSFGSCGSLTASFLAHLNIVSLLTYFLTYLEKLLIGRSPRCECTQTEIITAAKPVES